MSADSSPSLPRALDPQTWIDLVTVQAVKGDMFSARTLMTIHEGIEELAKVRAQPGSIINVTSLHVNLFERLERSFNNPSLLKEAGVAYLEQFRLPAIALKHFELAHQFGPKDRDIEELLVAAALAVAQAKSAPSGHSGINDAAHSKPEVGAVLHQTCRLDKVVDTRAHLDENAGELERKQELRRKSGAIPEQSQETVARYTDALARTASMIPRGDFSGASDALEEARKAGAPKGEVQANYAQLGLAAYDRGRMEDALKAFLQMRELGPDAVEGWFNCGLVYQKMGNLDDALKSYQEAVKLAPDNAKTWCNLSSVWFERGEHAEAEKSARSAIALKADYARAWDNLASALSAMNRLPEAAEACQQAIKFHSGLPSAWFKFGVINFQLDNLNVAAEAFNVVAHSAEFAAYVLYYLCMIEARRGDIDLAVEKLEQGRAMDLGNELERSATKEVALALTKIGDHEGAAEFYRQIVERRPEDFSSWLALGTAHHRSEQYNEASAAYLRATEIQPKHPVPWHNLGLLAADQGQHAESRDYFEREVELSPEDAKAWYDYGVSLKKLGLEDESAEAFERAEGLVSTMQRRSSDLSAALSIVRRLNLSGRMLKSE